MLVTRHSPSAVLKPQVCLPTNSQFYALTLSGRAGPPDPPRTPIGAPRTSRPTSSPSYSPHTPANARVQGLRAISAPRLRNSGSSLRPIRSTPPLRFGCHGNPSPAIRPPVQVSSFSPPRKASGFTLIELLVVIAIIAILAGLGFPALQGALQSGKKAQARNDIQQIVAAIRAFQLEYGRLPSATVTQDEFSSAWFQANNKDVINALIANDSTLNPRGVVFLEAKRVAGNKGGIGADGTFYDPWGTPYGIKLDLSYDNKLEYYDAGRAGDANVFSSALAVSFGPNQKQEDPYERGTDDIVSFK